MKERKKASLEITPRCAKGYSPKKLNGRWACVRDEETGPLTAANWFHADNTDDDDADGSGDNGSNNGGGSWDTNTASGSNTSQNQTKRVISNE